MRDVITARRLVHRGVRVGSHQRASGRFLSGEARGCGLRRSCAPDLEEYGPHAFVPVRVQALPNGRAHVAVRELREGPSTEIGQPFVHVAGEGEERIPLGVAESPDEVPAVLPRLLTRLRAL